MSQKKPHEETRNKFVALRDRFQPTEEQYKKVRNLFLGEHTATKSQLISRRAIQTEQLYLLRYLFLKRKLQDDKNFLIESL